MKYKRCFKCETEKPLLEFYKHHRMADGHLNKCKECARRDSSENYVSNIDKYKEYERVRAASPYRKAQMSEWNKRYIAQNPEKRAAVNAVNNAIRDGRIVKTPCVCCGSTKVHGHHEDYSKQLDVIWLCPSCHNWWHKVREGTTEGRQPF